MATSDRLPTLGEGDHLLGVCGVLFNVVVCKWTSLLKGYSDFRTL